MYKYIAMLTDFGTIDPYVGLMKSVILKINPSINIIDISHDISSFSIRAAAYILLVSKDYFPQGTIFLVVVDPGVGSKRRAVVVKTRNYIFVGPDNGVLYPAIIDDGVLDIRVIENSKLFLKPVSNTFHGRDIFAPVAAWLSRGLPIDSVGRRIDINDIIELDFNIVKLSSIIIDKTLCGEVIYVDKFGNIALNIRLPDFESLPYGRRVKIIANDRIFYAHTSRTFSLVRRGDIALYINSFKFLEIGVNMGNAAERLGVNIGDKICLEVENA